MTCIAANDEHSDSLEIVKNVFDKLGKTLIVKENLIAPATALCGSGEGQKLVSMQKKQSCLQPKQLGVLHL